MTGRKSWLSRFLLGAAGSFVLGLSFATPTSAQIRPAPTAPPPPVVPQRTGLAPLSGPIRVSPYPIRLPSPPGRIETRDWALSLAFSIGDAEASELGAYADAFGSYEETMTMGGEVSIERRLLGTLFIGGRLAMRSREWEGGVPIGAVGVGALFLASLRIPLGDEVELFGDIAAGPGIGFVAFNGVPVARPAIALQAHVGFGFVLTEELRVFLRVGGETFETTAVIDDASAEIGGFNGAAGFEVRP